MDNKFDVDLLIVQATIKSNRKDSEKKTKHTKYLKSMITSTTASMMDNNNISKYSPDNKDSPKSHYTTTVIPANRRSTPLDSGYSTNIGGMWNLKYDISSPKFYEIIINTYLKGDTAIDLKNLYNHINVCLNLVTILQEDSIPD